MNFCVGDIKHIKTTENKLHLECILRTRWALFCISSQFPPCRFSILTAISKPCPPFMAVCEETSTVSPDFFFWYLHVLRTVQYKTCEEEKKFDSRTWFFVENSSVLGVFGPRWGLQPNHRTVWKSAISPQPANQKPLKWGNTAYLNKRSSIFNIKFCVFQVTKT